MFGRQAERRHARDPMRLESLRDEQGFALVLAIAVVTLVTMTALSIMTLTQNESANSRRDQAKDGSYQAAEAGTTPTSPT